jgi:pilus assembly protein Flp/PilA
VLSFGLACGILQFYAMENGEHRMNPKLHQLRMRLQILLDEDGQDMVEYALVVALIGFASVASMNSLASSINNAFGSIGNTLTSAI